MFDPTATACGWQSILQVRLERKVFAEAGGPDKYLSKVYDTQDFRASWLFLCEMMCVAPWWKPGQNDGMGSLDWQVLPCKSEAGMLFHAQILVFFSFWVSGCTMRRTSSILLAWDRFNLHGVLTQASADILNPNKPVPSWKSWWQKGSLVWFPFHWQQIEPFQRW